MSLFICFVDPFNTPNVELKEDARCVVMDDGNVVLKEGSDTLRIGTLDAFYQSLPSRGEWTFCTTDKGFAEAVMKALEIGRHVGQEGRG